MATTGFGLPTSLLNSASAAPPHSIPPPPSFTEFRFQLIGQQPNLLKRFSEPDPTLQGESSSVSPEIDPMPMDVERNAPPCDRPSLFQALVTEPRGTFVPDASLHDNNASSTQFAAAKSNAASKLPFRQSSTSSSSAFVSSAPNRNSSVHASNPSSYSSSNPAPNMADQPISDVQPTRSPDRPPVPPTTRRYDTLRQVQTRLQVALPKIGSPNLTSAMLLVESAQQRTDRLYNEAHQLHHLCQDIVLKAQQGQATALHLIEAAEEARGVADGAKAELDRISSKEAIQQRNADVNEVRGLIQAVDDWIRNQEAAEAEMRAKKIQQLKLKRQKTTLQTSSIFSSHSPVAVEFPLSGPTVGPPLVNPPTSKQPLFFSPTPEVDVKMEQTGSQLHQSSAAVTPAAEQLRKRQADLRKKLQEKRCSAEAEPRAVSPSNVTQSGQQQSEEEKKILGELKRQENERRKEGRRNQEFERLQEERRREEQAQREIVARREAEKVGEEEARKRREMVEAEKKRRTEEERVARQATPEEMEGRAHEKAEAERKSKEGAEARAAQAAEERKQAVVFLNQHKETNDKLRQVPAELRRRRSQEAQDKQRRLAEEQARKKAEQEREDNLRQEQEIRRQQIQAEKNKTMADRAQQIWAQRGHRLIASQETTSEMSLDSSPQTANIVIPDHSLSPLEPRASSSLRNPPQSPNTQSGPILPPLGVKNQPLSTAQPLVTGQKSVSSFSTVTPTPRQISLPPVDHLSPTDSASSHPRSVPLSQPAMSVYRHSSDHGNVPYRENLTTSPQAQAANLKPLLNALKLPTISVVKVKPEPVPDGLTLSYPSEPSNGETSVQSSSTRTQNVGHQPKAVRPPPPRVPSPIASNPSQSDKNGLQTNAVVDKPVQSSVTRGTTRLRVQPQASKSSSNSQNNTNNQPEPRGETFQLAPSSPARSESPFRMGPDPLESRPISDEMLSMEVVYDKFSSQYPVSSAAAATLPLPYRGRLLASNSAPVRWEAHPAAPPAPKGANVYRPNYRERSRSPAAGMKRARSPGSTPIIRDYRDHDERLVPTRRISRSPPRRPRRPSRSPSPFYASDRPSLYARLDDTYRPPESRDSYSSRPELLNRFTEPRTMAAPPPGRPGRGRGKRGKGGPTVGLTHASLEQRISSTTLMSRLEDPPRRS